MCVNCLTVNRAILSVLLNLVRATESRCQPWMVGFGLGHPLPYTLSFSVPKWEAGSPHRHGSKIAYHAEDTRDAEHRSEDCMYGGTNVQ